jgi:ribosome maturation factor RimP
MSTDSLLPVVEPVVVDAGLELEELALRPAGRRTSVVVVVDGDVVDIEAIAQLSRNLAASLDNSGVTGDRAYTLEVTSRGVDRPLTLPRHWRRNVGRLVTVALSDGEVVSGRLESSDETTAVIGDLRIDFAEVARAVVEVEFNPPAEAP